jgi:hypothetical protein
VCRILHKTEKDQLLGSPAPWSVSTSDLTLSKDQVAALHPYTPDAAQAPPDQGLGENRDQA